MNNLHSNFDDNMLRNANDVMDPHRLGAMHQTRISFVRSLLRKIATQKWKLSKKDWSLCERGFGRVIYRLKTPTSVYHLVIFCDEIDEQDRNDRVIAEKWDVTFALIRGVVHEHTLKQLKESIPLQEAGRSTNNVLVLSRANKSVRIFDLLVNKLANGIQPDSNELAEVGYILRTTAVYGNGKFGIADFKLLENNPDFNQSFSAQMCAVYILRQFSLDWIHHIAEKQGEEKFSRLRPCLQRYLGVGNATGLGMAPYLIMHPCIVDQWMTTRERAFSAVLKMPCSETKIDDLCQLLIKAGKHLTQTITIDERQNVINRKAASEVRNLVSELKTQNLDGLNWSYILLQTSKASLDTQEILLSCLTELYPSIVDQFENEMNTDESLSIPVAKSVQDTILLLESTYTWAISDDYSLPENNHWFWYRSQDKEEPRLGVRGEEPGEEYELPLDIGRQANFFYKELLEYDRTTPLTSFLVSHPEYRYIARRVWTLGNRAMGEIQMNVLHKDFLPIHLLRCKLANFGATKFDPRSDRWVRVTFFQGAPLMDDLLCDNYKESWIFPTIPECNKCSLKTNYCIDDITRGKE
ncbi:hypothetical protein JCM19238_4086 [Vibrio ponticus]|nr:hypothetical protein JCM19238_4086 [Vibrio ponticus]